MLHAIEQRPNFCRHSFTIVTSSKDLLYTETLNNIQSIYSTSSRYWQMLNEERIILTTDEQARDLGGTSTKVPLAVSSKVLENTRR